MSKYIIFDMDGVIFDSEQLVLQCWSDIAKIHNIEGITEVFRKCIGTNRDATRKIIMNYYGKNFPYDKFREMAGKLFQEHVENNGMPMKHGVVELLQYLKKSDFKIGLASSTRKVVVEEELEMTGILQYFDVVIGGDMVQKSKPEPDIFLKCCSELGGNPATTIVVEDSFNGIRAASSAQMIPVMVPDMLKPDQEMREKAECIQDSLTEVMEWIQKR